MTGTGGRAVTWDGARGRQAQSECLRLPPRPTAGSSASGVTGPRKAPTTHTSGDSQVCKASY